MGEIVFCLCFCGLPAIATVIVYFILKKEFSEGYKHEC